MLLDEPNQFAAQADRDQVRPGGVESVQGKFPDLDVDPALHAHPATSLAVSGFSSLAYSLRAARNMWLMRTGPWSSTARKAALRAMLRMLPPVMFKRASLSASRPSVGVWAGKIVRQMSARCFSSGKGNWRMNRIRRRKAWSSALFRFVVKMARPR